MLLVWHAHMLNPRVYLEDCLRHGLRGLWHIGMPWSLVNAVISNSFNYNVSDKCKSAWIRNTGRQWDNTDDPASKTLKCPICTKENHVAWTTCGLPENSGYRPYKLEGEGYGDGKLQFFCAGCFKTINRQLLAVNRFVKDFQGLLVRGQPMPGTILSMKDGFPTRIPPAPEGLSFPRTFPNRLLKKHLHSTVLELLSQNSSRQATMNDVRRSIQDAVKPTNYKVLYDIDGYGEPTDYRYILSSTARAHTRKMMSRYWDNISPFALDLTGAVHRQGIFIEKMYKVRYRDSVPIVMLVVYLEVDRLAPQPSGP